MKIVNIALEALGLAKPFPCTWAEWESLEAHPRTKGVFRIVEHPKPKAPAPPEALEPSRDAKQEVMTEQEEAIAQATEMVVGLPAGSLQHKTKTRRATKKDKLNGTLGE